VDCTGDPGHTETLVDLHRYLVLDFEAQALLFREARMSNTSTSETVIEGYDPDTAETCRQTHTGWSTVCGQEIIALAL
jgi:hypothetical protein